MLASNRIRHPTVEGAFNPADLMTKETPIADIEKHTGCLGGAFAEGMHEMAAQVVTNEAFDNKVDVAELKANEVDGG